MTGRHLHHVGIAVPSIDDAIPTWTSITGSAPHGREIVTAQKVEVVFLGDGDGRVELLSPTSSDSTIARFLDNRGSGVHHLCYQVDDIVRALDELTEAGFEPIDKEPRHGAHNNLVAFLHPRSTDGVLIELLQERDG